MIRGNILHVLDEISIACRSTSRDPKDIVLVGVTKFADAADVDTAIQNGLLHIGENRVQSASLKFSQLQSDTVPVTKHLIGHLQTNKVKLALELFDLIQSIDSQKLLSTIQDQALKLNRKIDVLIQVNVGEETQKYGIRMDQAEELIAFGSECSQVNIKGLMMIAPLSDDKHLIRDCFKRLKELFDKLQQKQHNWANVEMKYLSMGMTADFTAAIEEGSNMIRVGRKIFGEG